MQFAKVNTRCLMHMPKPGWAVAGVLMLLILNSIVFAFDNTLSTDDFEYSQAVYQSKWIPRGGCTWPSLSKDQNHEFGGSQSLKISGNYQCATYRPGAVTNSYIEMWMYDSMLTTDIGIVQAGPDGWGHSMVGLVPGGSMSYYTYWTANNNLYTASTIPRSRGWHKIVFTFTSAGGDVYLDDQYLATNSLMTRCDWIEIGNPWSAVSSGMYFDDLKIWSIDNNYNVAVTQNTSSVTVKNGFTIATLNKSTARMTSLSESGVQLFGNGGLGYFDIVLSGTFYDPFASGTTCSIVRNTPFCAIIKFHRDSSTSVPIAIDLYHIFKRNVHGFYTYVEFWHDGTAPSTNLEQAEYVLNPDKNIFNYLCVDDTRIVPMPSYMLFTGGSNIYGGCWRLSDGSYLDKYWYTVCKKDNNLYGLTGNVGSSTLGMWNVFANDEFFTGGPLKQTPSVHQSPSGPIMLCQFQDCHYLGSGAIAPLNSNWGKCYGPVFTYLNGASDRATAYNDAKACRDREMINWPYMWLDRYNYYPLNRGNVTGSLNITDGSSSNGAIVVLAQPSPYWQFQSKDYITYARCDASGNFIVQNVRAGSYTLYAFVPGVLGEYTYQGSVNVAAGTTNDLGMISWTPLKNGKTIWQIGTPDRTSREFKRGDQVGSPVAYYWNYYKTDFPRDVNYTVGISTAANDWFYTQAVVDMGGWYRAPEWKINFNLTQSQLLPNVVTKLTIAIASAGAGSGLRVKANGTIVYDSGESPQEQARVYNSTFGTYRQHVIDIPRSSLLVGTNVITLQQTNALTIDQDIEYDCIRLEMKARGDINGDGSVGFRDFALFAADWLTCSNPNDTICQDMR